MLAAHNKRKTLVAILKTEKGEFEYMVLESFLQLFLETKTNF